MMANDGAKTGRWRRILLVASLGLNLAVIGLVVGVALSGGPRNAPSRFDLTAGPLMRAMDSERRGAVREALRESGAFRHVDRSEIRSDMQVILATLRAEQFDETAFRAALIRQRQRLQAGQDAILDAVTAQIDDMSAQERAGLAERLEEQLRRRPPDRERRDN